MDRWPSVGVRGTGRGGIGFPRGAGGTERARERERGREGERERGGGEDRTAVRSRTGGWIALSRRYTVTRDRGGRGKGEGTERTARGGGYVFVFPHWRYIRCKIRRVTTRAHRAPYTRRAV